MAHAMGSEIAIDTYILFAVILYLFTQIFPKREVAAAHINSQRTRRLIGYLNASLGALVGCLLLSGLVTGVTRYLGQPEPEWMAEFPYVFAAIGLTFAFFLLRLVLSWMPLFRSPSRHKLWADVRVQAE